MPKQIFHEREWRNPSTLACKYCDWIARKADYQGEDWRIQMDDDFVEHIPPAEREIEIWCEVNRESMPDGTDQDILYAWVMPHGRPVARLSDHINDGIVYFNTKCGLSLPIAKFQFVDGRVVKTR